MNRPFTVLSWCQSIDGCLDDLGPNRLILSGSEDLLGVQQLRAWSDAILVGANTIRVDNPRLLLVDGESRASERAARGRPEQPIKVTLTRSGELDPRSNFFQAGQGAKWVYTNEAARPRTCRNLASLDQVEVITLPGEEPSPIDLVLDLARRGVCRLMVEGGPRIIELFLRHRLVDQSRMGIAPTWVGQPTAPRLAPDLVGSFARARVDLSELERLGPIAVLWHEFPREQEPRRLLDLSRLSEAVVLAGQCEAVDRAYSVGAVLVDALGREIAWGFSREGDPSEHAEEAAIRKAARPRDLAGATLYSSMEPCSKRLSGRPSCVEHILKAGIARVVFALREPTRFVRCEAIEQLRRGGVEVEERPEFANEARAANAHLLAP